MEEITLNVRRFIKEQFEELEQQDPDFRDFLEHQVSAMVKENYEGYMQQRQMAMQQAEADAESSAPEQDTD